MQSEDIFIRAFHVLQQNAVWNKTKSEWEIMVQCAKMLILSWEFFFFNKNMFSLLMYAAFMKIY